MNSADYKIPFSKVLLNLLLLVVPTILVLYLFIQRTNEHLSIMNRDYIVQTAYFGVGMVTAYLLYIFRVRFIITFPLLILLLYTGYKSIEKYYPGEFDSFFASIRFMLFSFVFSLGWVAGFGLARYRHFHIVLSVLLVGLHIILMESLGDIVLDKLLMDFLPVVLYAFYIIYIRSLIDSMERVRGRQLLRIFWRYALFLLLMFFVFLLTWEVSKRGEPYKALEQTVGASGANSQSTDMRNDLLKKEKDQSFSMKDYAELRSQLGRTNELLFCSYLDNFFENTETPNPLYFTCYYLTKYDVQKEKFMTDPNMPSNDLFQPDPSQIPLFFTQSDSSVIKKGKGDKMRKVIDVDIYINKLSTNTFVSPSTAFSCQPITVEEDFKDVFRAAYRTKCYVSDLNSAYFVYNAIQPEIQEFQKERHKVLEKVKNYNKVDAGFLSYYTDVPKGTLYDSIRTLARELTAGAKTPVEKVIRIRDHFLSKTETGEPLFTYTLTPGSPDDPNIPNASKLGYFLFTNRKGYCTYFAGATLFMLRAVGVPTRMAAGFMTVDRADKNRGWYWFYGDQAHAWVQVYFPEYGWLDFDTTIGAEESRESPQPDGTPPIQPPKAWLAATGTITQLGDSITRDASLDMSSMVYHDKQLKMDEEHELKLDLKHAVIKDNTGKRSFDHLRAGDQVLVVSYDEKLKKLGPHRKGQAVEDLIEKFPDPVVIDEVHIRPKEEKKKEEEKPAARTAQYEERFRTGLFIALGIVAGTIILLLSLPWIIFAFMKRRARREKDARRRSYKIFRLSEYVFHQLGIYRNGETPLAFAHHTIDPRFNIGYEEFIRTYLKTKYASQPLNESDERVMGSYHTAFIPRVLNHYSRWQLFKRFINFTRTMSFFFSKPADEKKGTE